MEPLDLVNLTPLMKLTSGRPEIVIGLVDGPVFTGHADLTVKSLREIPRRPVSSCVRADSAACMHGTYVAGILSAKRGSSAPAICPDCTLLLRPIFSESDRGGAEMPSATAEDLAAAVTDCVEAGARIVNVSAGLAQPSTKRERQLEQSLDYAASHGTLVVAAAGNQGSVGSTAITRHPWTIPVAACDLNGRPLSGSNLGNSIGRRGLTAPGGGITSLGAGGEAMVSGGTSVAAPFVSGALALLWSEFPAVPAGELKLALAPNAAAHRPTIVPPLLNAWAAYQLLLNVHGGILTA